MKDIKQVLKDNYIEYASYVILDRAIPSVEDGLKPVQRRILHTLNTVDNGKFHKVANIVGQTMAFHPHGDTAIYDALVNIANKNFMLDRQGNFGNIYTGDNAAAARYIETRLHSLARETMFNKQLTQYIPSYDSRSVEPVHLPAKIPLLLMQGSEGIAVGMATRILPHNFIELLNAQIDILEEREFILYPDFIKGGIMDISEYDKGRGKIKVRAKIDVVDDKTLVVREICYGSNTELLIKSIDEAAKKGKIKIESISDYTAGKVEIEIKLPRGQYSGDLIEKLYAFTDCEMSISTSCIVIRDNYPWETNIDDILKYNTMRLKEYLKKELELERNSLLQKIFEKSLEQIFIENRLYKTIEEVKKYDQILITIDKSLDPYHEILSRFPEKEDLERLLSIPIRRISRFDIEKNQNDISSYENQLKKVLRSLKNIKGFTISYLENMIAKYADDNPRRTKIDEIKEVDKRSIAATKVKVSFDPQTGFLGSKVLAESNLECSSLDKILIMYQDGSYRVINIPEKLYVQENKINPIIHFGIADKKTQFRVVYKNLKNSYCYGKTFIINKFIVDKEYTFLEDQCQLELITTDCNISLDLRFKPKIRQKIKKISVNLDEMVTLKSVSARGVRLANKEVKKVKRINQKK